MPHRERNDGTQDDRTFNLYQDILQMDPLRMVQSVELPNNRSVMVLAITLVDNTAILKETAPEIFSQDA